MPVINEVAPGRLEIREGGGCLALFGAPFLAVGIFASLATLGLVTMRSDGQPATQATAALFAVLFTLVGGVLVFGRSVTAIDHAVRGGARLRHRHGSAPRLRHRGRVHGSSLARRGR